MRILDRLGRSLEHLIALSGELQFRGVTVLELAAAAGVAKLVDGLEVGEGTEALEPGVSPRARGRARRDPLPRNRSTLPGRVSPPDPRRRRPGDSTARAYQP